MSTTKGFLQQLVRTGQFRCVPVSEWDALTENQRKQLIRQARNTPPLTYSPVSLECKNLLRSYHTQGLLPGFHPEDLKDLTALEADFLIRCAENNRWLTEKRAFFSALIKATTCTSSKRDAHFSINEKWPLVIGS